MFVKVGRNWINTERVNYISETHICFDGECALALQDEEVTELTKALGQGHKRVELPPLPPIYAEERYEDSLPF